VDLGELVGRGRTSNVHAYGSDSVIKVPHSEVPASWPEFESRLTRAVGAQGVPAPEVRDVVSVDGRNAIVFERIRGPSLWEEMLAYPNEAGRRVRDFAEIHRALLGVGLPDGIPDLVDRLSRKINAATALPEKDRAEASAQAARLPRGAALLHGDMHPGNVLIGPAGPVVIDWFDAAIGHPIADIMRSLVLVQPSRSPELRHLPGATSTLLDPIRAGYVGEFEAELQAESADLATWQGVLAAGRLAEGAEVDESGLLALWHARNVGTGEVDRVLT